MRFATLIGALLVLATAALPGIYAADKEAWRKRAIYQLLTDRFAPVSKNAPALSPNLPAVCTTGGRRYCGGSFRSIIDRLPYIQGMGIDAIWISPVHSDKAMLTSSSFAENLEVVTHWGEAYHGYWVTDVNKLNPRFGNATDLKALSKAVHDRGMLLMVDIVVNFAASLSTDTSAAALAPQNLTFKKPEHYHPLCWIDYNSQDSVEKCWIGDGYVPLMDYNTENAEVQNTLNLMIKNLVTNYGIDGLRIDAAKHVPKPFWNKFCAAAGVFCMGEAWQNDIPFLVDYQKSNSLDSLLNYAAFFNGVKNAFQVPGRANMNDMASAMIQITAQFPDPGVLGNFLANHDVSRFRSVTASESVAYNALVWQHLFDGIPITYYGEEQEIKTGVSDPDQRQALWAAGMGNYSTSTKTYKRIQTLNTVRKFLMSSAAKVPPGNKTYLQDRSSVVLSSGTDLVFTKGPVLVALNNRASLNSSMSIVFPSSIKKSGFQGQLYDVLHCKSVVPAANGSVVITYNPAASGSEPLILMTLENAALSGLCRSPKASDASPTTSLDFEPSDIAIPDMSSSSTESASNSESTSIDTVVTSGRNSTTTEVATATAAPSASSACRIKKNVKKSAAGGLVRMSFSNADGSVMV